MRTPSAVAANHQAEAVVLDLVQPVGAGGRRMDGGGPARRH
jgi:hypothetical protein